jgi:hypothetical protein
MLDEYVLARIESIQQELEFLKKTVAVMPVATRHKTRLKGLWQDLEISEDDVKEAKHAIFRFVYPVDSLKG